MRIKTKDTDFDKIARLVMANLCHYLDSRLNFMVIDLCLKHQIVIFTNHDCFYVCPTKKPQVLEFYFQSFIDLLVKEDIIEHFFGLNKVEISPEIKKQLDIYKTNRSLILDDLKSKQLTMSSFILSS
jgi:hypothetical protein